MNADRLDKILKKFWKTRGNNDLYFLGRCADVSYALQQFLGGRGEIYTIGGNNKDIAWHTVLKIGPYFFDIRGKMTPDQVMFHNPIALHKGSIAKAGPKEIQHIISLLNHDFVTDTIEGLKKADSEI